MSKFNFFKETDISTTDFSNHRFNFGFVSSVIMLMVDSTDPLEIIEYSFDSVTVAGTLSPTKPSAALAFDQRRESGLWLRLKTAGDPVVVRIEAWS